MKRLMILAVLVTACGDGSSSDPHAASTCDGSRGSSFEGQPCEAACETLHDTTGPACDATFVVNGTEMAGHCDTTFEYDGIRGCCGRVGGSFAWTFAECH